ncbi:MAG: NAD(P)H-hydrate epimerase [Anaerolineales bacterium]|nr:NAD(P)H-hydrate epimerase [Anaerolineales bacterium]
MFQTKTGQLIPTVDEAQMREVDRIAVEGFGLGLLQMMENAGRDLAACAIGMLSSKQDTVITILAGSGGNGGGGICCARHLYNRGYPVNLILNKSANELQGAAAQQWKILQQAGLTPISSPDTITAIQSADLVIDALIGYSLRAAPRGRAAELIELANHHATAILSLDLPSGMDATTGETPGAYIMPQSTLTLALPKTGLKNPTAGNLLLGDIGIPPQVYEALGITFKPFFGHDYLIELIRTQEGS